MAAATARTEKLDLRVSAAAKRALKAAAIASRQSVSEFVLDSALTRAEQLLADQTRIVLSGPQWEAFVAALDAPPSAPPARLRRLMGEPSLFER
jgi:uncharacterized protein (DUF1778 family)